MRNGLFGVNAFGILALQTAYESGDEWLQEVMEYVAANYRYMASYFAKHMPTVKLIEPEGTYLVWADFRGYGLKGDDLYAKLMDEAKVFLNNGNGFGEAGDGFLRFNIACSRKILAEALQRICRTLEG